MQTTQIAKLTEQLAHMAHPQTPAAILNAPTSPPVPEPQNNNTENTSKKNKKNKSKNLDVPEASANDNDKNDDNSVEERTMAMDTTHSHSDKATVPPTAPAKEQSKKISWADMVRQPKLSNLPAEVQEKFKKSAQALNSLGFKPTPRPPPRPQNSSAPQNKLKPKPVPVYFGGIPRGPIGKLRAMLRECLPKWSVLNISFIGNSATKLLCHEPLVDNLAAGMKLLGYRHLPNYDPVREMNTDAATLRGRANCYQRWRWGAENAFSEVSREWFAKKMDEMAKSHPEVKATADEKQAERQAEQDKQQGKDQSREVEKGHYPLDTEEPNDKETENQDQEKDQDQVQVQDQEAQQRPEGEAHQ
ncbi:MAG: hypothetical protein AAGJ35_02915 [Myxococcota bacterium]